MSEDLSGLTPINDVDDAPAQQQQPGAPQEYQYRPETNPAPHPVQQEDAMSGLTPIDDIDSPSQESPRETPVDGSPRQAPPVEVSPQESRFEVSPQDSPVDVSPQQVPAQVSPRQAPSQPDSVAPSPQRGDFASRVASVESGNNPNAKNPNSSASGLYQFTDGTWRDVAARHPELHLNDANRMDPRAQKAAFTAYAQDNYPRLARAIGRAPTDGELYLAHFLGPQGATNLLNADADAPVTSLFGGNVVAANRRIFLDGSGRPKTAGQFYTDITSKFHSPAPSSASMPPHAAQSTTNSDIPGLTPIQDPDASSSGMATPPTVSQFGQNPVGAPSPAVSAKPAEMPKPFAKTMVDEFGRIIQGAAAPQQNELEVSGGKEGANVHGAPPSIRLDMSLSGSKSPKMQLNDLKTAASNYYGKPLGENDVRVGPQTNLPEYRDPSTGQWHTVEGSRLSTGAIVQYIPDLAGMVTATMGATGGAAIGSLAGPIGAGAGEVSGAGLGAGAAEYVRLKLGQMRGLNQDLTEGDLLGRAAMTAGITATAATVIRPFSKLAQGAWSSFLGSGALKNLGIDAETAAASGKIAGNLNSKVQPLAPGYKATLSETLDTAPKPKVFASDAEQIAANKAAIAKSASDMLSPEQSVAEKVGKKVTGNVARARNQALSNADTLLTGKINPTAEADLKSAMDVLSNRDPGYTQLLRSQIGNRILSQTTNEGFLDGAKLGSFLTNPSNQSLIKGIYGDQHVDNLKILADAARRSLVTPAENNGFSKSLIDFALKNGPKYAKDLGVLHFNPAHAAEVAGELLASQAGKTRTQAVLRRFVGDPQGLSAYLQKSGLGDRARRAAIGGVGYEYGSREERN